MRVLLNAGPWLAVPPSGYGGIENVVATLVAELRERGVRVVLATVGTSTLRAEETIFRHEEPQFPQLQLPYNRVMGCVLAHMQQVVRELSRRDDIDLVHDHVEAVGPAILSAMGTGAPPTLHTLHWDLAKHPAFYEEFDGGGRLFVNGVSAAQLARAPAALRAHSVGHVHLATPLAYRRGAAAEKGRYAVVLGRITAGKGQHIAARLAHRVGMDVVLAGPVGPYDQPAALDPALAGDADAVRNPDVRYWRDQVQPLVDGDRVRWLGSVGAAERDDLLARAAVSLFPLQWEEPGGTAVVESLALGTPVAGYRRGCLPELIDDGLTGVLVEPGDEDGLAAAMHAARRLDPRACRLVAVARFSPAVMADRYLELYERVRRAGEAVVRPKVNTACRTCRLR
ncbi:glycosyltransferase [Amycolatopsis acidiphila]|nr:glycosyltransferase [Amycolatopsis acidiphila]UIJ62470.1 glycosyltransferase [Amycolatopsis acidiphila]GHG83836.1 glycosyl transferase [Amycolatopsis acidiphila]